MAEFLPVLDSFERAIEAECTDESFKNGMKMIYNQFIESLDKIGVKEMEALEMNSILIFTTLSNRQRTKTSATT